jgi:hypothetical protein
VPTAGNTQRTSVSDFGGSTLHDWRLQSIRIGQPIDRLFTEFRVEPSPRPIKVGLKLALVERG